MCLKPPPIFLSRVHLESTALRQEIILSLSIIETEQRTNSEALKLIRQRGPEDWKELLLKPRERYFRNWEAASKDKEGQKEEKYRKRRERRETQGSRRGLSGV